MKVEVAVSNRHVHVTEEVWKKLFGDINIEVRNNLNQPGQFASTSTVDIKFGDKVIPHVRIVGPFRKYNQVEVALTDANVLGVNPPRRQSGDLEGSLPITLIGPNGKVNLDNGLIMAEAHIHMDSKMASDNNFVDKDEVNIIKDGKVIMNAKIKITSDAYFEMHIDKDEELLYDLHQGNLVEFEVCGK